MFALGAYAADDGGTVINDTAGRSWYRMGIRDEISIRHFGAKGDGASDDGPIIQAATNVAAALGKTLSFPPGDYFIATPIALSNNTSWRGEIGTLITISPTCAPATTLIAGLSRSVYGINISNVRLQNIVFQGTPTGLVAKGFNVSLENVSNVSVVECTFQNFGNATYYTQGCVFYNCTDIDFVRSRFIGNSGDGCAISNTCTRFRFVSCTTMNNGDWGFVPTLDCSNGIVSDNFILNNTSTGTGADRCVNVAFASNIIQGSAYGLRVCRFAATSDAQQYVTATGNIVTGQQLIGISIEGCNEGGTALTGNVVAASASDGINISDSCCVGVVNNVVTNSAGTAVLVASYAATYETGRINIASNLLSGGVYGVNQASGPGTLTALWLTGNSISSMSTLPYNLLPNQNQQQYNAKYGYFDLNNTVNFSSGVSATNASTGSAALPAAPATFVTVYKGGLPMKIALYNP